ncbi:MAG TPA: lipase family protein [Amycolatopsis sp.]
MTKRLRHKIIPALTAGACAAALLCAPTVADAAPSHGALLSAVPVQSLDQAGARATLDATPFGSATVRYGLDAYRVTYRTTDRRGRPTTASGLVVLPRTHAPRTAVYEHGTRSNRADVASVQESLQDRQAGLVLGAAGYVAVLPDYLGLGTGPGFHPYLDSRTEASATLDLLRAARTLTSDQGKRFDPRIFVSGFSQGGQAAMAAGQALQGDADPGFRLAALAPVSGPYDARGAELPGIFDGRVAPDVAVFYLSYWTVSMNRLFPLYGKASEVFRAPYDQYAESLFDGSHSEEDIFPRLAATPAAMFTDSYLNRVRHLSGPLLDAARDSDGTCSDWRPRVPVRLFASDADTQVPITNSLSCQRDLRAHGVDAPLTRLGATEHLDTPTVALPQIVPWFNSLR